MCSIPQCVKAAARDIFDRICESGGSAAILWPPFPRMARGVMLSSWLQPGAVANVA
jgi:hypothetical protein